MFKHFANLRNTLSLVKLHAEGFITQEALNDFTEQLNQRTRSGKPIIMVYGVYSAGKSTLINALAGEELAAVGVVPTTDTVDSYTVGDVEILDTPGIDAPIEHEQISREQLAKSDAVIFVLDSSATLEEKQTYDEIGNILAAKKPLIVVMNNTSAIEESSTGYQAMLEKFRTNLYNHFTGNEALLERLDQVTHFLVDAQTALKAKLEGKQKLLEHSQLPALEQAVSRLFSETSSVEIAQTLEHQLYALLEQAITQAQAQNSHTSAELQQLGELIKSLQSSQHSLLSKISARIESQKPALKSQATELLQAGNGAAIQALAQQWEEGIAAYYQEQVERECQMLSTEAVRVAELFVQHSAINAEGETHFEANTHSDFIEQLQGAFKATGLQFKVTEEMAKKGIFALLQQGKSLFPQMFKGIGVKTMGKMATRYAPVVGVLVDLGSSVYDYHKAQKYEQSQINAQRQYQERLRNEAHAWVDNQCDNLQDALAQGLHQTFNPIQVELQKQLQHLSTHENSNQATINKLEELKMRLCNG